MPVLADKIRLSRHTVFSDTPECRNIGFRRTTDRGWCRFIPGTKRKNANERYSVFCYQSLAAGFREMQESKQQATTYADRVAFWIPELDGLRAVACGLVVVAHFNPWIKYKVSPLLQPAKAIMGGNVGVMLFFCLSAFLLTSICLAELERKGRINLAHFFLRRILRIWPLYFVMLAVTMLAIWPGGPLRQAPGASTSSEQWAWATRSFGWYALFVGNWLDHKISEIGILWTICVEEQFYFTLPFALMLALRWREKVLLLPVAVVAT
jgi:peptidoglycan/LPS O-acetylase OafA/YrhL